MTILDLLADELGTSGRTLRRAAGRGLIRCERPSERRVLLGGSELVYVRDYWPLLSALLEALRKQPNVRLAVLYGSTARGEDRAHSDLDLLVRLRRDDFRARARLAEALEAATERPARMTSLEQAEEAPLLLADVLRDGRVLVDRDGDWSRLRRRERKIRGRARAEEERLEQLVWRMPDLLEQARKEVSLAAR